MKKNIHVSCIIIMNDKKILILKRNSMGPRDNLWEFPGGKLESGESEVGALKREIKEELNLKIDVDMAKFAFEIHFYIIFSYFGAF